MRITTGKNIGVQLAYPRAVKAVPALWGRGQGLDFARNYTDFVPSYHLLNVAVT